MNTDLIVALLADEETGGALGELIGQLIILIVMVSILGWQLYRDRKDKTKLLEKIRQERRK